jgi:hypothetical protein
VPPTFIAELGTFDPVVPTLAKDVVTVPNTVVGKLPVVVIPITVFVTLNAPVTKRFLDASNLTACRIPFESGPPTFVADPGTFEPVVVTDEFAVMTEPTIETGNVPVEVTVI